MNFFSGMLFLLDGFKLLTVSGIKRYVIIPLLINILLFIGAFLLLSHYFGDFNHWLLHFLPHWLQWLGVIIWLLFFVSFFILFIYTFVTLANIVAAPFNSLLAEKIEIHLTGKSLASSATLLQSLKDIPRSVGRQIGVFFYYIPRALLLFILFFIPLIQTIAPICWFAFNAWFFTFTYIDYPTDNHKVNLSDVKIWLKKHRGPAFGFGVAIMVATLIPVINFFVMPAAVAGATKFWLSQKSRST